METVYDSKFISIKIDEQKLFFFTIWKEETQSMTTEQMKEEIGELARQISSYSSNFYLADNTQNHYAYQVDEQEWVGNMVGKACVQSGVKKFALILPKDLIGSIALEQTAEESKVPFDVQYFETVADAKEWLGV